VDFADRHGNPMSDWIKALRKCSAGDPVPAGFKTREQIGAELGLSTPRTGAILRKLITSGLAEKRMLRVETPCGVRPVPHYRIKP